MNFSDLTKNLLQLYFQDLLLWKMNTVSHSVSYSHVFFVKNFCYAVSSWSSYDPIFYSFDFQIIAATRPFSLYLLSSRVLCISITFGFGWRIRLDYTRQPSLQTFRPECLVNYTLSLSNADPVYRNKGRSAGAARKVGWETAANE